MTALGDRAHEASIQKAAAACTEHAIERVHNDFNRLRHDGIACELCLVARCPQGRDKLRQYCVAARELATVESLDRFRLVHRESKRQGINMKRADDTRIETLKIEYDHIIENTWIGIEYITAGTHVRRVTTSLRWCNKAFSVQSRQVEKIERCDGSSVAIERETR